MLCTGSREDKIEIYMDSLDGSDLDNNKLEKILISEDPLARTLSLPVYRMYSKANDIYRESSGNSDYIRLISARRTTRKQATLNRQAFAFSKYKIGSQRPANYPGQSFHEYGYAIDVDFPRSTRDRNFVIRALKKVDFIPNKPKEKNHFEAEKAAGYTKAKRAIKKIRDGKSYKYGEYLAGLYQYCVDKNNIIIQCKSLVEKNKPLLKKIEKQEAIIRKVKIRVDNDKELYNEKNRKYTTINNQYKQLNTKYKTAKRKADTYPYTQCPRKNPLPPRNRVPGKIYCDSDPHQKYRDEYYRNKAELNKIAVGLRKKAQDFYPKVKEAYDISSNAYNKYKQSNSLLKIEKSNLLKLKQKNRDALVPIYRNQQEIDSIEEYIDRVINIMKKLEIDISNYVRSNMPNVV